ncbi:MAG: alpha/beta fold hydrolase [Bacteroidota bacterium]
MLKIFLLFLISFSSLQAQSIADKWYAKIDMDGEDKHYVFDIRSIANGYEGLLDDINNALFRLPLDSVSVSETNEVYILHKGFGLVFQGEVAANGASINGTMEIISSESEAVLSRTPQVKRTQLIKKKKDYTEEEVNFSNSEATRFSGTLSLPEGSDPCPAVVLISGSGPQDRNSEILGHKPFAVLADHLASRGVAVLRYDDRGYGRSEGQFRPATSMDYADDAQGAVNFLKQYPNRNFSHIGLIGHSEGGNIAPVVASRDSAVNFLVLLAAPGVSNFEHYITSLDLILKAYPETYDRDYPFYLTVYRSMAQVKNPVRLKSSLRQKFTALSKQMTDEELDAFGSAESFVEARVERHTSTWYRHYLQFDVTPYLRRLQIPVLVLNGDLDTSVESTQNLSGIRTTLLQAGNDRVTTVELKNVNHFFQVSKDDKIESVYFNEETFSKEALEIISDWIDGLEE